MKVQVSGAASRCERERIVRLIRKAARVELCPAREVSVVLVDNRQIRSLNRRFLKRDRPTDVLAFPIGGDLLGEIYVSREQARRQARACGLPLREELPGLVLHGFLHLLGYTHQEMPGREREYLSRRVTG